MTLILLFDDEVNSVARSRKRNNTPTVPHHLNKTTRRRVPQEPEFVPQNRRYFQTFVPPENNPKSRRRLPCDFQVIKLSRRYFQNPPPIQILSGKIKRWRTIKEDFQPAESSPAVILPESIYAGLFEKFLLFDN